MASLSPYRGKPKATCSAGGFFTLFEDIAENIASVLW